MNAAEFDYDLPPQAIAQHPVEPRSAARLLVALGDGEPVHATVADLPDHVEPGDVVVVNETRVLPARLALHKATGGAAEVLLLEPLGDGRWTALVRPARRLPPGTLLYGPDDTAVCRLDTVSPEYRPDGVQTVELLVDDALDRYGAVPLPPYITEPLADPERYQTVYARLPGSVAAPTAGLHLTPEILDRIEQRGASVHTVDLAVGLGTFRPVTAERVEDHVMHEERYHVPSSTSEACRGATGRVIAIGTTTVRALESAAASGRTEGRTDLFITPGFAFKAVDVLLTNFHQPRSSLLVLLAAFAGRDRWRPLYETALADGYRFLSFGDAMLVSRAER